MIRIYTEAPNAFLQKMNDIISSYNKEGQSLWTLIFEEDGRAKLSTTFERNNVVFYIKSGRLPNSRRNLQFSIDGYSSVIPSRDFAKDVQKQLVEFLRSVPFYLNFTILLMEDRFIAGPDSNLINKVISQYNVKKTRNSKTESIIIRKFGPIKNVEINPIKPFTIFIGESGSGKSTIIKTIALFRWLYKMLCIRTYLKDSNITNAIQFTILQYFINNEQENFLKPQTEIIYQNGSIKLVFKNKSLIDIDNLIVPADEMALEKISFICDKRSVIPDIYNKSLSIIQDGFYLNETYDDYITALNEITELQLDFLNLSTYLKETKTGKKIYVKGTHKTGAYHIELNEASSGIQNAVPANIIIEYYTRHFDIDKMMSRSIFRILAESDNFAAFRGIYNLNEFANKRVTICYEEPELGLFPDAQSGLMDFIANRCFNTVNEECETHLLISTHSPYILNYINVLMHEELESKRSIPEEAVAVYLVEDGETLSLMCTDDKGRMIIDTNRLTDNMRKTFNRYQKLMQ